MDCADAGRPPPGQNYRGEMTAAKWLPTAAVELALQSRNLRPIQTDGSCQPHCMNSPSNAFAGARPHLLRWGLASLAMAALLFAAAAWRIEIAAFIGVVLVFAALGVGAAAFWWHRKQRALRDDEAVVRGEREQFRVLFENSMDAVLLTELGGAVLEANPAACAMFGRTARDLCGAGRDELVDTSDPRWPGLLAHREQHGRVMGEIRLKRADGTLFEAEVSSGCFLDRRGLRCSSTVIRDITAQRRAERALRESEERFRSVVESAPDAIFIQTRGTFAYANAAALEVFGAGMPEELIGRPVLDRFAPEVRDQVAARINRLNEDFQPVELCVEPCLQLDGQRREIEVSAVPFRFKDADGALVFARDIGIRKRAEEELGQRLALQDQLAKIAEMVPGLIFSFKRRADGSFCVPFCTAPLLAYWGLSPEDLREDFSPALQRINAADVPCVLESIAESARTMTIWRHSFRVAHPERGEVWLEGQSMPKREADGSILWHGHVQDVTERKRAELALRASESHLRMFFQHAPASLAMFDREMRYIDASKRWRADYGLDDREVRGRSLYEVFPDMPEEWKAVHRRALAGEVIIAPDDSIHLPNRGVLSLRWEVRPWFDGTNSIGGIVIFSEDITTRKRAEQAAAARLEELQRWQKATLGREIRVLELKGEVNALLVETGRAARYTSVLEQPEIAPRRDATGS